MKDKSTIRKLFILVIALILLTSLNYRPKMQSVVPTCFDKEECAVPLQKGYCDVKYDCVVGKCYSEQIKCPEICYGGLDEDMDSYIDCNDEDCFSSIYCSCYQADYNHCVTKSCYCAQGSGVWVISEKFTGCLCQ